MSYTSIYKVPKEREIEKALDLRNAWLGAANVWQEMSRVYLANELSGMMRNGDGIKKVWDLWKDPRVNINDRIVLATTFDYVMVRRGNLTRVAEAMRSFGERMNPGHLMEQVECLRELSNNEDCYAVCWVQTSVSADMWMTPEDGDSEEWRMYDISRDNGHWFLFKELF